MAHPVSGPQQPEDRIRIEEFRRMGIAVGEEFGAWNATIPVSDGERTLARHTLHRLLDDVDEILAGGDPRAAPG